MSYQRGDRVVVVKSTSLSRGDVGTIDKVWAEPDSQTYSRDQSGFYRVKFDEGSVKRYGEYYGSVLEYHNTPVEEATFEAQQAAFTPVVGDVVIIRAPGEFWNVIATVTNVEYGMAALVPVSTTSQGFGSRIYLPVQYLKSVEVEEVKTVGEITRLDEACTGWVVDPNSVDWTPKVKEEKEIVLDVHVDEFGKPEQVVLIQPKENNSVFNVIRTAWNRIFGSRK
jgi:hypothetical protein